ncbi:MAG: radical SAM protein [Candidatus Methanofastidiosia archaeon]
MKNNTWGGIGSKFSHLTSVHPCYSEQAHFKTARIHLPVAPKCNIQCNFCKKGVDKCEYRPGAYSHLMKPREAVKSIKGAMEKFENLKVVGIAGPGEPLFNEETFETLKLVDESFPDLHKCIATNGLLLPEKISELKEVGVGSITVTVNGITPKTVSSIVSWIYYKDKIYKGEDGAWILIRNQMKGIGLAVKNDFVVKINTVLIPTINMGEIEGIAKEASQRGAWIMNIIPLIPLQKFENMDPPDCDEIKKAREAAEKHLRQFRLCRQCRADSVGVPGKEHRKKSGTPEYFHG